MGIPRNIGQEPASQLLSQVQYELQRHPVLAALATKIWTGPSPDHERTMRGTLLFRITFDGSPFAEAQHFEAEVSAENAPDIGVEAQLRECEKQVAEAIRKAL